MESIKHEDFSKSLKYLFKETFEGSPKEGGVYLDTGVGLFNTIENVDSEKASRSIAGANIAAHTEHIGYYLAVLNNFIKGIVVAPDWNKTWEMREISEDRWTEIKENLRKAYDMVTETFEEFEGWNDDSITEATAIVIHTAYHLGAIRQIAKTANDKQIAIGGEH